MSKKINRNDPCYCNSGKKYKNCCIHKNTQPAKHTADGKFKFSAAVLPKEQQAEYSNYFAQLTSFSAESLLQTTQSAQKLRHQITKNKGGVGKKTIRSLKAKEDRDTSKKLQQHSYSVMNLDIESAPTEDTQLGCSLSCSQEFIPTTEDYRERNNEEKNC